MSKELKKIKVKPKKIEINGRKVDYLNNKEITPKEFMAYTQSVEARQAAKAEGKVPLFHKSGWKKEQREILEAYKQMHKDAYNGMIASGDHEAFLMDGKLKEQAEIDRENELKKAEFDEDKKINKASSGLDQLEEEYAELTEDDNEKVWKKKEKEINDIRQKENEARENKERRLEEIRNQKNGVSAEGVANIFFSFDMIQRRHGMDKYLHNMVADKNAKSQKERAQDKRLIREESENQIKPELKQLIAIYDNFKTYVLDQDPRIVRANGKNIIQARTQVLFALQELVAGRMKKNGKTLKVEIKDFGVLNSDLFGIRHMESGLDRTVYPGLLALAEMKNADVVIYDALVSAIYSMAENVQIKDLDMTGYTRLRNQAFASQKMVLALYNNKEFRKDFEDRRERVRTQMLPSIGKAAKDAAKQKRIAEEEARRREEEKKKWKDINKKQIADYRTEDKFGLKFPPATYRLWLSKALENEVETLDPKDEFHTAMLNAAKSLNQQLASVYNYLLKKNTGYGMPMLTEKLYVKLMDMLTTRKNFPACTLRDGLPKTDKNSIYYIWKDLTSDKEYVRAIQRKENLFKELPELESAEWAEIWKDVALQDIILNASDEEYEKAGKALVEQFRFNEERIKEQIEAYGIVLGRDTALWEMKKHFGAKMLLGASAGIVSEAIYMLDYKNYYLAETMKIERNFQEAYEESGLADSWKHSAAEDLKSKNLSLNEKEAVKTTLEAFKKSVEKRSSLFEERVAGKKYTREEWSGLREILFIGVQMENRQFEQLLNLKIEEYDKTDSKDKITREEYLTGVIQAEKLDAQSYKDQLLSDIFYEREEYKDAFKSEKTKKLLENALNQMLEKGSFVEKIPATKDIRSLDSLEELRYSEFKELQELLYQNVKDMAGKWAGFHCLTEDKVRELTIETLLDGKLTDNILHDIAEQCKGDSTIAQQTFEARCYARLNALMDDETKKAEIHYLNIRKNAKDQVRRRFERFVTSGKVWEKIWNYKDKKGQKYEAEGTFARSVVERIYDILKELGANGEEKVDKKSIVDALKEADETLWDHKLQDCIKAAGDKVLLEDIITEFMCCGMENTLLELGQEGAKALYLESDEDYFNEMVNVDFHTVQKLRHLFDQGYYNFDNYNIQGGLLTLNLVRSMADMSLRVRKTEYDDEKLNEENRKQNLRDFGCATYPEFSKKVDDLLRKNGKRNYEVFRNEDAAKYTALYKERRALLDTDDNGRLKLLAPYLLKENETWQHMMLDDNESFNHYLTELKKRFKNVFPALDGYGDAYMKLYLDQNYRKVLSKDENSVSYWKDQTELFVKNLFHTKIGGHTIDERLQEIRAYYNYKYENGGTVFATLEANLLLGEGGLDVLYDMESLKKSFHERAERWQKNSMAMDKYFKDHSVDKKSAELFKAQQISRSIWVEPNEFEKTLDQMYQQFTEQRKQSEKERKEAEKNLKHKEEVREMIETLKNGGSEEETAHQNKLQELRKYVWSSGSPILAADGITKEVTNDDISEANEKLEGVKEELLKAVPVAEMMREILIAEPELEEGEINKRAEWLSGKWNEIVNGQHKNLFRKMYEDNHETQAEANQEVLLEKRFLLYLYIHEYKLKDDYRTEDNQAEEDQASGDIQKVFEKYKACDEQIRELKNIIERSHAAVRHEGRDVLQCLYMGILTMKASEFEELVEKEKTYFREQSYLCTTVDQVIESSKEVNKEGEKDSEYKKRLKQGLREVFANSHNTIENSMKAEQEQENHRQSVEYKKQVAEQEEIIQKAQNKIQEIKDANSATEKILSNLKKSLQDIAKDDNTELQIKGYETQLEAANHLIKDLQQDITAARNKLTALEGTTADNQLKLVMESFIADETKRQYVVNSESTMGAVKWDDLTAAEINGKAMTRKDVEKLIAASRDKEAINRYNEMDLEKRKLFLMALTIPKLTGNEALVTSEWMQNAMALQMKTQTWYEAQIKAYISMDKFEPDTDYSVVYQKLLNEKGQINKTAFKNAMAFAEACTAERLAAIPKDWGLLDGTSASVMTAHRLNAGSDRYKYGVVLKGTEREIIEVNEKRIEQHGQTMHNAEELKEWILKNAEIDKVDNKIVEQLNGMKPAEMQLLIQLLQKRSVVDYTTCMNQSKDIDGIAIYHVNEDAREELVGKMKNLSQNTDLLTKANTASYSTQAMRSLLSFQLRDDVDLRGKILTAKDFAPDALKRKTLIDWKLLKNALNSMSEIENEMLRTVAVRQSSKLIDSEKNPNEKAKKVYNKTKNQTFDNLEAFENALIEYAKEDLNDNPDIQPLIAGYFTMTPSQRCLFIRALCKRDIVDVSKKNMIGNFFGNGERDYINPEERDRMADEYVAMSDIKKGNLNIYQEDLKNAFTSLLSTQIDDDQNFVELAKKDKSLEDVFARENTRFKFSQFKLVKERKTAFDWKLFARAMQFANRTDKEAKIIQEDRALYYAGGQTYLNGEFRTDMKFLRRNLHKTGSSIGRATAAFLTDQVKSVIPLQSLVRKAVIACINAKDEETARKFVKMNSFKVQQDDAGILESLAGKAALANMPYDYILEKNALLSFINLGDAADQGMQYGKLVGTVGQAVMDATHLFADVNKISASRENIKELDKVYEDSDKIEWPEYQYANDEQAAQAYNARKRTANALMAAQTRLKGDSKADIIANCCDITKTIASYVESAYPLETIIESASNIAVFVMNVVTDSKMTNQYLENGDGHACLRVRYMKSVLRENKLQAFDRSQKISNSEYMQKGMGFESSGEMSRYCALEMIRAILFGACRFNPDKQLRVQSMAVLKILDCESAIGHFDSKTADMIYKKLSNRA